MANYIIGLDFGTYQSKASINNLDKTPQKHEFFEFGKDVKKSFFLSTKVFLLENGLMAYGNYEGNDVKHEFNYFKIASAEDERFQVLSDVRKPIYNYVNSYHGYSPEFLSVLYITYVLLIIREHYNNKNKSKATGVVGGLLSGLRRRQSKENNFIIRMGIPTEYSKEANLLRRRKFETILLISDMIQKELDYSVSDYLNLKIDELLQIVRRINSNIPKNEGSLDSKLKENHLSVFPESAAGLLYFVKSGRLQKRKLYASIDIGGGTSDLSFFNVLPDGKIEYYASESYMNACNNIYLKCNGENESLEKLKDIENKIQESIKDGSWWDDDTYNSAVSEVKGKISNHLKSLILNSFQKKLGRFNTGQILSALEKQPILVYGGGLAHPKIKSWKEILIFDNGNRQTERLDMYTYMDVQDINLYKPDKSLIINKSWEEEFPFLIVAFGLSYLHHIDESYWDDSGYSSIKLRTVLREVQHPRNEGMYVYKVIERKWE